MAILWCETCGRRAGGGRALATVCRPVAAADTRGAFYRRWRVTAVDGTTFDLPDTTANVEAFGRPLRQTESTWRAHLNRLAGRDEDRERQDRRARRRER